MPIDYCIPFSLSHDTRAIERRLNSGILSDNALWLYGSPVNVSYRLHLYTKNKNVIKPPVRRCSYFLLGFLVAESLSLWRPAAPNSASNPSLTRSSRSVCWKSVRRRISNTAKRSTFKNLKCLEFLWGSFICVWIWAWRPVCPLAGDWRAGQSVGGRSPESYNAPAEHGQVRRGERDHGEPRHRDRRGEPSCNTTSALYVFWLTGCAELFWKHDWILILGGSTQSDWKSASDLLQRQLWKIRGCREGEYEAEY